jgi:nitroreductase
MKEVPHNPHVVDESVRNAVLDEEYRLASSRRSVRFFSDRAVPREVIERLIAIAGTAPSGANMQPWCFVAIDDTEMKRRVRHAAEEVEQEFYDKRASPEWLEALAPLGTNSSKPFIEIAPWLVIVFRQRWQVVGDQQLKTYYSSESVGIAVGMMIAAIHRAGLVTLTHTPAPMKFLRELCGRPENETPFVLLPIGYPAENCAVPDIHRRPIGDIIQWNAPPP